MSCSFEGAEDESPEPLEDAESPEPLEYEVEDDNEGQAELPYLKPTSQPGSVSGVTGYVGLLMTNMLSYDDAGEDDIAVFDAGEDNFNDAGEDNYEDTSFCDESLSLTRPLELAETPDSQFRLSVIEKSSDLAESPELQMARLPSKKQTPSQMDAELHDDEYEDVFAVQVCRSDDQMATPDVDEDEASELVLNILNVEALEEDIVTSNVTTAVQPIAQLADFANVLATTSDFALRALLDGLHMEERIRLDQLLLETTAPKAIEDLAAKRNADIDNLEDNLGQGAAKPTCLPFWAYYKQNFSSSGIEPFVRHLFPEERKTQTLDNSVEAIRERARVCLLDALESQSLRPALATVRPQALINFDAIQRSIALNRLQTDDFAAESSVASDSIQPTQRNTLLDGALISASRMTPEPIVASSRRADSLLPFRTYYKEHFGSSGTQENYARELFQKRPVADIMTPLSLLEDEIVELMPEVGTPSSPSSIGVVFNFAAQEIIDQSLLGYGLACQNDTELTKDIDDETQSTMNQSDEVRAKAKRCLLTALQDRSLDTVLAESRNAFSLQASCDSEDELRIKAKQCLVAAAVDGSLDDVLAEIAPPYEAPEARNLQGVTVNNNVPLQAKVRNCLLLAMDDSSLQGAIDDMLLQIEQRRLVANDVPLHSKVFNALCAATRDGSLDRTIDNVIASRVRAEIETKIQTQVRRALVLAVEDGSLEKGVENAMKLAKEQAMHHIDADDAQRNSVACTSSLREQVQRSLVSAYGNGSLDQAVAHVMANSRQTPDKADHVLLQTTVGNALLAASKDGSLEKSVFELSAETQATSHPQLQTGTNTKLDTQPNNVPNVLDEVHARARRDLLVAWKNGSLEQALDAKGKCGFRTYYGEHFHVRRGQTSNFFSALYSQFEATRSSQGAQRQQDAKTFSGVASSKTFPFAPYYRSNFPGAHLCESFSRELFCQRADHSQATISADALKDHSAKPSPLLPFNVYYRNNFKNEHIVERQASELFSASSRALPVQAVGEETDVEKLKENVWMALASAAHDGNLKKKLALMCEQKEEKDMQKADDVSKLKVKVWTLLASTACDGSLNKALTLLCEQKAEKHNSEHAHRLGVEHCKAATIIQSKERQRVAKAKVAKMQDEKKETIISEVTKWALGMIAQAAIQKVEQMRDKKFDTSAGTIVDRLVLRCSFRAEDRIATSQAAFEFTRRSLQQACLRAEGRAQHATRDSIPINAPIAEKTVEDEIVNALRSEVPLSKPEATEHQQADTRPSQMHAAIEYKNTSKESVPIGGEDVKSKETDRIVECVSTSETTLQSRICSPTTLASKELASALAEELCSAVCVAGDFEAVVLPTPILAALENTLAIDGLATVAPSETGPTEPIPQKNIGTTVTRNIQIDSVVESVSLGEDEENAKFVPHHTEQQRQPERRQDFEREQVADFDWASEDFESVDHSSDLPERANLLYSKSLLEEKFARAVMREGFSGSISDSSRSKSSPRRYPRPSPGYNMSMHRSKDEARAALRVLKGDPGSRDDSTDVPSMLASHLTSHQSVPDSMLLDDPSLVVSVDFPGPPIDSQKEDAPGVLSESNGLLPQRPLGPSPGSARPNRRYLQSEDPLALGEVEAWLPMRGSASSAKLAPKPPSQPRTEDERKGTKACRPQRRAPKSRWVIDFPIQNPSDAKSASSGKVPDPRESLISDTDSTFYRTLDSLRTGSAGTSKSMPPLRNAFRRKAPGWSSDWVNQNSMPSRYRFVKGSEYLMAQQESLGDAASQDPVASSSKTELSLSFVLPPVKAGSLRFITAPQERPVTTSVLNSSEYRERMHAFSLLRDCKT